MVEIFRYCDSTDDELTVDVVERPYSVGHPRPLELMFTNYSNDKHDGISVILPVEQVLKLLTVCRIEIDAIRPDPDDVR